MPLLNTITTPYAEAFLQVAESRNEVDEVVSHAKSLLELWNSCPEFSDAMSSPVLEVNQKKAALEKLFSSQVTPTFLNLLKLLADRQRIGLLNSVLERLLEIYREQRNIALATITSASALNEDQQSELLKKVQSIAGTDNLEIDLKVDSELLGGFVVNVGSKVIDASIAGQVRRLVLLWPKSASSLLTFSPSSSFSSSPTLS
jgi:F-type H+-transporting ATPase subunit delta